MSDAEYSDSNEAQEIKRRKIEKKIDIVPSSSGSDEELLKNNTNRGESNETEDESYDKTKMRHQMQSMGTEDKSCDAIKMRQEMQPESVVLRGNEETVTTRRGPTKPSQSQETQPVLDSQRPRPNQDQPTWLSKLNQMHWDEKFPLIMLSMNSSLNNVRKFSNFAIVHGFSGESLADLCFNNPTN
ncbi:hypothetical protein QYM36_006517, partial [Artemia franciscana]